MISSSFFGRTVTYGESDDGGDLFLVLLTGATGLSEQCLTEGRSGLTDPDKMAEVRLPYRVHSIMLFIPRFPFA